MDGRLVAEILWSGTVNCAMEQNRLPLIQRLNLWNRGEEPLCALQARLDCEPGFAEEWNCEIPFLPAGEKVQLDLSALRLSSQLLAGLPAQAEGRILLSVEGEEGELLHESYPVILLAPHQWPGRDQLPELTAAYIAPHDPGTAALLEDARVLLADWGAESFSGYRSQSREDVLLQMKALYEALRARGIAASDSTERFPRLHSAYEVLADREGSALELTLLYCGCLEAAGLHPLVVFEEDTVSAGCWLEERCFAESVQDDLPALWEQDAENAGEILLVDPAAAALGQGDAFEEACALAGGRVLDGSFLFLLDIERARQGGIAPLSAPAGETPAAPAPDAEPSLTRQQVWERRLLDLSLRNMLINFRVTRNALQLIAADCGALEDAVSSGADFQVAGCPEGWEGFREERRLFRIGENQPEIPMLVQAELEAGRLHAFLPEQEVRSAMTVLYRQARLSLEENGSNTLFLAIGLLKWYESEQSAKPRYAPLVLLPVDIIRKSSASGYVMRMRDEEPQMNITLLEMLRQDFGIDISGLDPLPRDRRGVNLEAVFAAIRREIAAQPRWDVEALAFLGLFSFSQFIMWSDIRNRAGDLRRSKIVRSLMSGRMEWTPDGGFPDPERLDEEYLPADTAVPITADASQLAAICAAGKGKSFVLHGPPGTGKSQTITNIIANALYQGKTVLFLAEKMAALSVVQKRLEKIGLGPFALELHSNKAKKRDVLSQLEHTLSIGHIKPDEAYEEQAARLYDLRRELNGYVQALHRKRACGFSAWEAITRYEASKDAPADICFLPEEVEGLTARTVQVWEDIAEEMQAAAISCGGPAGHPLREWRIAAYSSSVRSELGSRLAALGQSLERTKALLAGFCTHLGLPEDGSIQYLEDAVEFARLLRENCELPACLIAGGELAPLRDSLDELCGGGRRRDAAREALLITYQKEILLFNEPTARKEWEKAADDWLLPRLLGQNRILKSLRALARDPKALMKEQVETCLNLLAEYDEGTRVIAGKEHLFAARFGPLWKNREPDWRTLEQVFEKGCLVQAAAARLTSDSETLRGVLVNAARCYLSGRAAAGGEAGAALGALIESFEEMKREAGRIWALAQIQTDRAEDGQLALLQERQQRWAENLSLLRGWCNWMAIEQRAVEEGLSPVAAACRSGAIEPEQLLAAYHRGLYSACADTIIESEPVLSGFHGAMFESKVRKFRRLCSEFEQLTRRELVARLSAKIPAHSAGIAASSETGILQKAIRSGGRTLSIRRLFDSIPNLLRLLCPCMLMSPISVAQYIDPQYPPFDLVIFDEASQLPTCEAVGAIARGENVIVVGDPKQLPPTSFFVSAHSAEGDFEQEDLESILDDCLAISMPEEHLLWHYRSRHESLIAFSNRQYYGNLYTFPSPSDLESKVTLVPVNGSYDRGRSKQNRAEAEAVVGEILRRLSDETLAKESIGVVTFSSVQQNLIEDLLLEAFCAHPELEERNAASEEPVFIKNLENVQGDERDVILFSIGYGPDENGRVALNFGPLNREGGWRRLNVAVSRARREMKVYSTLRAEQIDLSRTRSEGVAGLKAFLEFAEKGYAALAVPVQELSVRQQPFAELLASHVKRLGYDVRTNVGCSAFRIDLAVIDPRYPGEYLLGILCDGETYAAGQTARDRNMNQESVLRSLGWNLHHVWVLEWREDPVREISRIREAIEAALRRERHTPVPTPPEERRQIDFDQNRLEREPEPEEKLTSYTVCRLPVRMAGAEEFCLPAHDGEIFEQLKQVLETEAPISEDLLCRRVMNAWGITRMTARVERRFALLLEKLPGSQTHWEERTFYWSRRRGPRKYTDFRVPGTDDFRRDAEDIPPEELANAVRYVLERQVGLPREDLVREVYRLFGFQRAGSALAGAAEAGLRAAVRRGYAEEEDGRYVLPQG